MRGSGPVGLWEHVLYSAYRVVLSIIIAVILAAPAGMAVGQAPMVDRIASPLIYLVYPVPKIVLLPVIMLFLGVGEASKIFIISLILYFQILVLTRDAAYAVRPELVLSVRSLGARRRHLLRYVYFPAVLPSILSALRITSGTAIAVLFFTETFATHNGSGLLHHRAVVGPGGLSRHVRRHRGHGRAGSQPLRHHRIPRPPLLRLGTGRSVTRGLVIVARGSLTPAFSGRVVRHFGESAVGKPRNPE